MTSTLLVTGTYDDQGPARRPLSRMGNRWGDGLPPKDAYERHSRLAVVTGEDLIDMVERAFAKAVGGFQEYGRTRDDHDEVGHEAEGVGSRSSSPRVPVPVSRWQRRWTAWTFR